MRLFCSVVAISCLLASAAVANAQDSTTVVPSFTLDNLKAAAERAGFSDIEADSANVLVTATSREGVKLALRPVKNPLKKNESKYHGLFMSALFEGWAVTAEQTNQFSRKYVFATAVVRADSRAQLHRLLTADYGIPFGNVTVELASFGKVAEDFKSFLDTSGLVASLAPVTKPVSYGGAEANGYAELTLESSEKAAGPINVKPAR